MSSCSFELTSFLGQETKENGSAYANTQPEIKAVLENRAAE